MALLALLLSGTAFMIQGLMAVRGSQIVAMPPEEMLLFRDTGPNGSTLWLAVPVSLINAAGTDYGDVVRSATLELNVGTQSISFPYQAVVEQVMMQGADRQAVARRVERAIENCPIGARCISGLGSYVVQRPRRLLDVPGGSSRSEMLAFMVTSYTCEGSASACEQFRGYPLASATLRRMGPLDARVVLDFHFDDSQTVRCRVDTSDASWADILNYFERTGWVTPGCVRRNSG